MIWRYLQFLSIVVEFVGESGSHCRRYGIPAQGQKVVNVGWYHLRIVCKWWWRPITRFISQLLRKLAFQQPTFPLIDWCSASVELRLGLACWSVFSWAAATPYPSPHLLTTPLLYKTKCICSSLRSCYAPVSFSSDKLQRAFDAWAWYNWSLCEPPLNLVFLDWTSVSMSAKADFQDLSFVLQAFSWATSSGMPHFCPSSFFDFWAHGFLHGSYGHHSLVDTGMLCYKFLTCFLLNLCQAATYTIYLIIVYLMYLMFLGCSLGQAQQSCHWRLQPSLNILKAWVIESWAQAGPAHHYQ